MSDTPQIAPTLTAKIAAVERWIAETEDRLANARQDLAHLKATLQLFRRGDATRQTKTPAALAASALVLTCHLRLVGA